MTLWRDKPSRARWAGFTTDQAEFRRGRWSRTASKTGSRPALSFGFRAGRSVGFPMTTSDAANPFTSSRRSGFALEAAERRTAPGGRVVRKMMIDVVARPGGKDEGRYKRRQLLRSVTPRSQPASIPAGCTPSAWPFGVGPVQRGAWCVRTGRENDQGNCDRRVVRACGAVARGRSSSSEDSRRRTAVGRPRPIAIGIEAETQSGSRPTEGSSKCRRSSACARTRSRTGPSSRRAATIAPISVGSYAEDRRDRFRRWSVELTSRAIPSNCRAGTALRRGLFATVAGSAETGGGRPGNGESGRGPARA